VSNSMYRRRRWRAFATTVALALGSLAIPATALADGQLDPAFNGTGLHVGTVAEGTVFNNVENRVPMVVQADGRIVVGGSRGGFMTLVRYNVNGTIDTTFGVNGFATRQFSGTPAGSEGNSGAVAMTLNGGNIIVAGFGGSQSMVAARFTANGVFAGATVCYAPHLIDYTARALAMRGASVVLVGYARDRHPAFADPVGLPVMYGQRAIVTLPATAITTATGCGGYVDQQGSTGVTIDGLTHAGLVTDATLSGRYYEGVAATATNYTVASTTGTTDGTAWVQRFAGAGVGALDATFNGTGRVAVPAVDFHAIQLAADGSAYVAGESVGATAADRQMVVARILATGGFGAFGGGGIARIRVGGGNNTGEALVLQGTNVIVGGTANLAGRASFGLARLTAAGLPDPLFGAGGQTATPIGIPQVNAYITGMALTGNFVAVSGRASDPSGLAVVAGRYYHTGAPPPPLPPPVATTSGADQITASSARVGGTVNAAGTASNWWIEYGTTTAYGSQTPAQALPASNDDVSVAAVVTGLAPGTLYHARIVIASTQGTDPGDDVAFTTLGVPAPAGTTPGTTTGGTTTTGGSTTGGTTTTVKKTVKRKLQCVVSKVVGKKLNAARRTLLAKGCKVQLKYKASKKAKSTILTQSRKAGKKLSYRAVVRLTVATTASALKA
jgi:uncharacterized delta-60 repeat protein